MEIFIRGKNYQPWEKAFIYLCYPNFSVKEIAEYLGRPKNSIQFVASNTLKIKKIKVYNNQHFGKLTVIGLYKKNYRGKIWECKCECGKIVYLETNILSSGHSQSCGCGRIEAISRCVGQINGQWFARVKTKAIQRGYEFNITKEYLSTLLEKQQYKCALTGMDIEIKFGKQAIGSTASLDRIDNTKGYIEGNLQFVYKDVNIMKNIYNQDFFIKICNMIAKKHPMEDM